MLQVHSDGGPGVKLRLPVPPGLIMIGSETVWHRMPTKKGDKRGQLSRLVEVKLCTYEDRSRYDGFALRQIRKRSVNAKGEPQR